MRYLVAVVMLGLCGCVQERTGVSQNEIPAPALRRIQSEAPGKIHSVVRETERGRVTYHANVTSGGKNVDVVVDGGGELVSRKER